jgi:CHAT domain-containing protein/tetratricopeptide (TPR) repeat protein
MEHNEIESYVREAYRQMDQGFKHPSFRQLLGIATGETLDSDRLEVEKHLSQCDHCARQLREFEHFRADCEAPYHSHANRDSALNLDHEWNRLQRRIFWRKVVNTAPRWGRVAAVLVVACGAEWFAVSALMPSIPRLLATAYQQKRTIEYRIAGGGYAPIRIERGNGSAFSSAAALLKAEAKLTDKIRSRPEDPDVLRLQGEAEILERNAGAAVQTLRKAIDFSPQDARILADLGAAYALRGDLGHQPADYPNALEYLSKSVRLQRRADVIFNRALVLERMLLKDQAILEWQAYLKLDATSEWAAEARKHLAKLTALIKTREDALALIVDDPAKFLALADSGKADAEAFLTDVAITKWLPRNGGMTREAAARLAQILKEKHDDSWLSDVLRGPLHPGAEQLAAARFANETGKPDSALGRAREAERSFSRGGNHAGSLWARFEVVSSLHSLLRSGECFSEASKLLPEVDAHSYAWLRAQARLEYITCAVRLGRMSTGIARMQESLDIARGARFGDTALRAGVWPVSRSGFYGGMSAETFAIAEQFLQEFWDGAYRSERFRSFADTLRILTDQTGQRNAAWFLARSELWAAQGTQDDRLIALAHALLAASAQAVGEEREASQNLDAADRLYRKASPLYRPAAQTLLAGIEIEGGHSRAAVQRLESFRADMSSFPLQNKTEFFRVMGEAYRRTGRLSEAADAFAESIRAGELRITSLSGERERAGIVQTIEKSYRGLVAIKLGYERDGAEALRTWQSLRALDSIGGPVDMPLRGKTVLSLVELPEEWIAWLSQNGQVTVHHIPVAKSTLAVTATRFRRECSDPKLNAEKLRVDAQQLYSWMVEPFAPQLTNADSELIFELDGALAGVPVQALISRDGRYLGDRFAVLVSSGYRKRHQEIRLGQGASVLLISNPELAGNAPTRFPPLPDAKREAETVGASFPNVTVLDGREATAQALSAALPRASIFHFAGHGYSDSENGALILAPQDPRTSDYELLQSSDLMSQDWSRCRLAVLSACAAAAGEIDGPHNPDSLVRALTRAGVPRVAASLWNVDSAATSELISAFYSSLATGINATDALRTAQERVRRHPEWSHPYYWAGFELFGTI